MRVDIFKSKFNETDFDPTPENDVTAIEDFEDASMAIYVIQKERMLKLSKQNSNSLMMVVQLLQLYQISKEVKND